LNICGTEDSEITDFNDECDSMFKYDFDNYGTFDIDKAKRLCSRSGTQSNKYKKLILFVFLLYVGMNQYGCLQDEGNGRRRPIYVGQNINHVLQFYLDTIINIEDETYKTHLSMQDIPTEVKETAFELIDEFHAIGKTYKLQVYNKMNYMIDKIKNVLNHGLYISIGLYFGDSKFYDAFYNYEKGSKRPALRSLDIKKEYNPHAMVIVDYCIDKGKDVFLIKNSWSKDWGINGTIQLKLSEILLLEPIFLWIEPTDFGEFTHNKSTECTFYSEDEIIHEDPILRELFDDFSIWYDINVGTKEINEQILRKIYKKYCSDELSDGELQDMIYVVVPGDSISKEDFLYFIIQPSLPLFKWYKLFDSIKINILERNRLEYIKWFEDKTREYHETNITKDVLTQLYKDYVSDVELDEGQIDTMIHEINKNENYIDEGIDEGSFLALMNGDIPSLEWYRLINRVKVDIKKNIQISVQQNMQTAGNKKRRTKRMKNRKKKKTTRQRKNKI